MRTLSLFDKVIFLFPIIAVWSSTLLLSESIFKIPLLILGKSVSDYDLLNFLLSLYNKSSLYADEVSLFIVSNRLFPSFMAFRFKLLSDMPLKKIFLHASSYFLKFV